MEFMKRALKVFLGTVLSVLAFAAAGVGLTVFWVNSDGGREQLARLLEKNLSAGEMRFQIGALEGDLPGWIELVGITAADREGVWLRIDRARLRWRPAELLDGLIWVDDLSADTVDVARKPLAPTAPPTERATPVDRSRPPALPFGITLNHFGARRVQLAENLLGVEAAFSVAANALVKKLGERLDVKVAVHRIDATPGSLTALAAYHPASRNLTLDIHAHEPAGGLAVRTLGVPGHPEISLSLAGKDPIDNWTGRLALKAGEDLGIEGTMQVKQERPGRFALDGQWENNVQAFLPAEAKPLLGRAAKLDFLFLLEPGAPITIERLAFTAPAGNARIKGRVDPERQRLDLSYQIDAGPAALFTPWIPGARWQTASAQGGLNGEFSHPSGSAHLLVRKFAGFDHHWDRADMNVTVKPNGRKAAAAAPHRLAASGSFTKLAGPQPEIARFAGERVDWEVQARFLPVKKRIDIQTAELKTALARLTLSDSQVLDGGKDLVLKAGLTIPDLAPVSELAGRPLQGNASLQFDGRIGGHGQTLRGKLNLETHGLATDIAAADALLGEEARVSLIVDMDAHHNIEVENFHLQSPSLEAAARGSLASNQTLAGKWSVALSELAVLSDALNMPLKGDLNGEGSVAGPLASPNVSARLTSEALEAMDTAVAKARADIAADDVARLPAVKGRLEAGRIDLQGAAITGARVDVSARELTGSPSGRVEADLTVNDWPVLASTDFALKDGDRLALNRLDVVALGMHVVGALKLALDTSTARGKLEGELLDPALLSRLADQDLGGDIRFQVELSDPQQQNVKLTAQARDLTLDGGDTLRITRARLGADVRDAAKRPQIVAEAHLEGLLAAAAEVQSLDLAARGTPEQLGFDLAAAGRLRALAQPFNVKSSGVTKTSAEEKRLQLTDFSGTLGDVPWKLTQPATLSTTGRDFALAGFELLLDQTSRVSADASFVKERITARARIEKLSLALLRLTGQAPPVSGVLDGTLSASGSLADPEAALDLKLADIDLGRVSTVKVGKGEAVLQAILKNKAAQMSGNVLQPKVGNIEFEGQLPVDLTQDPFLPESTPLSGRAKGRIDIGFLNEQIMGDVHNMRGELDLDASLGGTLGDFRATGNATLHKGFYEHLSYGTLLDPIELTIEADAQRIHLARFEAKTPEGGTLSASGDLHFKENRDIVADFALASRKAQVVAIDSLSGSVSSDLTFTGPINNSLLKGTLTVDEVEAFIPENLPSSVVVLDVTEAPGDGTAHQKPKKANEVSPPAAKPDSPPMAVTLDLNIQVPGKVYVRGRGLDTELEGKFHVTGTHIQPNIDGNLQMRRGTLNILNRQFKFSQGQVSFDGVPKQEPTLNFKADAKPAPDARMAVLVTGPASRPSISLWSDPELPQDEILSRILFGKSAGSITPMEAVELAASVATLTGASSGPGILDKLRRSLGLDTLKFNNDDERTGPGVEAGRYIADGVYLGVGQGIDSGSSHATIEVEVTPNISLESDVGADSQGRVGINMEWDY
ncbi:MAG: translocation/assembly module TamB domain-containing protein [Nitrospinaceae bacterium]|nr:MAG: translocation/assembly module TamB domain-containing protein [Nitrospinaceae bacterium]